MLRSKHEKSCRFTDHYETAIVQDGEMVGRVMETTTHPPQVFYLTLGGGQRQQFVVPEYTDYPFDLINYG